MMTVGNILSKIRNEKWDISDNPTYSKRLIRACYEKLNENIFGSVDEMGKFLEIHKLPKLNKRLFNKRISLYLLNELNLYLNTF